jgi:hypothetical protein
MTAGVEPAQRRAVKFVPGCFCTLAVHHRRWLGEKPYARHNKTVKTRLPLCTESLMTATNEVLLTRPELR